MDGAIRVLHVDDAGDFAALSAEYLEREDDRLRVETATSAGEGLDRLDDGIDCVVSDYEMPDRNGIEFLEAVREVRPDLPFVLFTGKGSEAVASDAISAGVTDYLRKRTGREQYRLLANRVVAAVERRRAENNYREVFEKVPDGIVIHDAADGSFTDMNARYAEMFGYEREELLDAGFGAILPDEAPYTVDHARERIEEAVEGGPRTFEWPGITRDGDRFRSEVHLAPVSLHGRDRILAVVRDVTRRTEREEELRARGAAMEASIDGMAILDPDGTYVFVNRAHAEVYGYDDPDVFVGETWRMCYEPAEVERIEGAVIPALDEHGEWQGEATGVRADGTTFPQELSLSRIDDGRIVCVVRDVTERKARERRLRRQNDRLDEFVSTVSHDLRNPLNVAAGRLELAREERDSEHLDDAASAIARSQSLIEELLTMAREGDGAVDAEPVDLGQVTERCWESVATEGATLAAEADRTVRADRGRLRRLLENLLRNAVEHGSTSSRSRTDDSVEHGSTDSRAEAEDVTVVVDDLADGFYVADDGPGVPPAERDRIFESGYSTTEEGTGFGLPIVERIADAHGWAVEVGEAAAGGARFEITGVERPG